MNGLGTRVIADGELTEVQGLGKLAAFKMDSRDLLQRLAVEISEAALFRQVPLTRAVILEQRPAVEDRKCVV